MLYDKGGRHFTRFDAEGNEDTGFETAIKGILQGFDIGRIKTMTVDPKTGTLFVAVVTSQPDIYAVTETSHNTFTRSNGFNLASFIGSGNTIQTAAAYNGTLFFTVPPSATSVAGMKNKLVAVKAELSGSSLTLSNKIEMELPKLRTAGAFGKYPTNCTGLFADENNVYCLLTQHKYDAGKVFALGQLVRYTYSGSTLTEETKIGLHSKAGASDSSLAFEAGAFVNPIGFIGSDEDYIYIADDGYNIEYLNENWRINGNKNRIAAFNRKTNEITFTDTDATWYGQKSEYKFPNTKILLWERLSSGAFRYWTSASGTDSFTSDNKLFESSTIDTFCYDQDGNLYILWKDVSNYKVRRFELKEDGSYAAGVDSPAIDSGSRIPKYIAVDISDGQNYLYYTYEDGPNKHIQRYSWNGTSFSTAMQDSTYGVHINVSSNEIFFTALAANKDGVFVATKEKQTVPDATYTLKVTKYKKDSPGTSDGKITIVSASIAEDTHSSPAPYNEYDEAIYDLRIVDGVLYAVTSKIEKGMANKSGDYCIDSFKNGSVLYKVGQTANTFTGSYDKEFKKEFIDPPTGAPPGTKGTGYGFYRFIAVKPKKLVIASDSAWGKDGITTSHVKANNNKVFEYDLDKNLLSEKGDAGGTFSKELAVPGNSGFKWE